MLNRSAIIYKGATLGWLLSEMEEEKLELSDAIN